MRLAQGQGRRFAFAKLFPFTRRQIGFSPFPHQSLLRLGHLRLGACDREAVVGFINLDERFAGLEKATLDEIGIHIHNAAGHLRDQIDLGQRPDLALCGYSEGDIGVFNRSCKDRNRTRLCIRPFRFWRKDEHRIQCAKKCQNEKHWQ